MKKILITVLGLLPLLNFAQEVSFKVEELSKPTKLLSTESTIEIYKDLILQDQNLTHWEIQDNKIDFKYNILAQSKTPNPLVNFGAHSFFNGMYKAYADHRSFVLSPDMIWLLISQGFARHVNAQPEKLRELFVDFSGKLSLVVKDEHDLLNTPSKWEQVFPEFTKQITEHTNPEFVKTLTSDFSTTTAVEKVASEITIMETMKPYFEYVIYKSVCGIPNITLKGKTEDWQKILNKVEKLKKYDLEWWTIELEPILQEFVNASKGDVDKTFWRNMFKYHSQKQYGAPKIIDGWIVKFFPYNKDGKRNNLKKLIGGDNLPDEIVKVDLKHINTNGINTKITLLELWAGFIGVEQNTETFALTPKIGWMIKKKDVNQTVVSDKLKAQNTPFSIYQPNINLKILEVPEVLKELDVIYSLGLHFKENVFIPEWMKTKKIGKLLIKGKISKKETAKILTWFPKTKIELNNKTYNEEKSDWVLIPDNKIPTHVLKRNKIWILEIWESGFSETDLIIPDELGNIEIEYLILTNSTSDENIKKLIKLLPNTTIYKEGKKIK